MRKFEKNFQKHVEMATHDMLDLARVRIDSQVVPGGAVPGKGGGLRYVKTAGATIQRVHNVTGRPFGDPIFHKLRVVSRSNEFANMFKKGSSNLSLIVKRMSGGFQALLDARLPNMGKLYGLELGQSGSKARNLNELIKRRNRKGRATPMVQLSGIRRQPIWKGLKYAHSRFQTLLAKRGKPLEKQFNG